ncbi:amidase [Burkholderiaceae bacterium FT117]|uniref:amidase n=1 Tax=Zeimonas sediminis TaxID=2944268 RepID=UPI002342DE07|nr:amidase [Zeimonas sediminis]MCM5571022.1 amidase [Zeimonas sediminis]
MTQEDDFPIDDRVNAWVPHGRFVLRGAADGPLSDLSFAVKDIFDVAGHPTGAGNPAWLATHPVPTRSSPVVERLLEAGATMMGKVLTDELAYSLHGDNAHYGAPINARAPGRVTGGSSSGSAAAVAAGLVDFALGTDTGGSTRIPASYCGLWGLRTTHGLLSAEGMVPLHPSYDTVTWLAHDARTFSRVGTELLPSSGFWPSRLLEFDDASALADPIFDLPMRCARRTLESLVGTDIQPARASQGSSLEAWRQVYVTTGAHEGWKVHGAWIAANRPAFGAAIEGRWRAASQVSDEAAAAAGKQAAAIRSRVRALVGSDAVVVLPSAASVAPLRDADPAEVDAVRMRTMAITCIAGLAGLPQVSIPMESPDGQPVGISLIGPAGSDLALIRIAQRVWQARRLVPAPMA